MIYSYIYIYICISIHTQMIVSVNDNTPSTRALALQSSIRNCSPPPDLLFLNPIFARVFFSGGVFSRRHRQGESPDVAFTRRGKQALTLKPIVIAMVSASRSIININIGSIVIIIMMIIIITLSSIFVIIIIIIIFNSYYNSYCNSYCGPFSKYFELGNGSATSGKCHVGQPPHDGNSYY